MRNADLILVLKNGELVEQGRYAELVRLGGLFAELDASGCFVADVEDPAESYAEPDIDAGVTRIAPAILITMPHSH